MGFGDYLMLSGQVRELKTMFPQFKVVCPEAERTGFFPAIFKGNPYVSETRDIDENTPRIQVPRVEVGVREDHNNRIAWKPDFHAIKGDLYLTTGELAFARDWIEKLNPRGKKVVVISPYAKSEQQFADGSVKQYPHHVNKEWDTARYAELVVAMPECVFIRPTAGSDSRPFLDTVIDVKSDYREACALIAAADLYLGCEGGLHHAAAALGKRTVVIFGGWISPITTGYGFHENLFVGAPQTACGNLSICPHCQAAMAAVTVTDVRQRMALALGP